MSSLRIAVFALLPFCLSAQLPVLIVDGMNNHDWQAGTRGVKAILLATGRFTVDVSTTPDRTAPPEAWDTWRPQFAKYKAVIVNFNGGHQADGVRWPAQVERALDAYVRSGGGLIVLHAANNAFLQWPDWNRMIGLGWREKTFGPGIVISDAGKPVAVPMGTGLNPGHGPRHDFQMRVIDRDHPITRGMPELWMHPSEQLTHGQHGPAEGLTILTSAWSKDVHENEPMDWVRNLDKGRIYVTMLGHTWKNEPNPNLDCVGFQTLFSRGVEWAASGKVTIPIPADFPKPDKVSLHPLL
jgi:type 1 glutamine amidotransferase